MEMVTELKTFADTVDSKMLAEESPSVVISDRPKTLLSVSLGDQVLSPKDDYVYERSSGKLVFVGDSRTSLTSGRSIEVAYELSYAACR